MINDINKNSESRMQKSIDTLKNELTKLRTGRAHTSLLEHVMVPYYGSDMPLNQVANISVADSRTLVVTPWEKNQVAVVEKAIRSSDLGLNPATSGDTIRVPLPPLNEERRREIIKIARQEAENARVAIRNIRRDANNQMKDLLKQKEISEDDERRNQDFTQKLTDKFISEVDKLLSNKETELMEI